MRRRRSKANPIAIIVLVVVIIAIPFFVTGNYHLSIMIFIAIHAMLAMGLCLLMGYAGQISLGHTAFFGIGAYASGILTVKAHLNPWLAMLLALVFTGLVAYVLGIPIFRLKGHNLAMATLGFGIIVYIVFVEWSGLTGGPSGLSGIPSIGIGSFEFDKDVKFYYLAWALAILLLILSLNIVDSRVGRALRAIDGSEIAAEVMGVDSAKYKIQIFVVGAVFASVAGSLYAHYLTFLNPGPFGLSLTIALLVMVVIGGLTSAWGAVLGAGIITMLTEVLRGVMEKVTKGATGEYEIIVFGMILMLVMIFMPQGLVPALVGWVRRLFRADRGKPSRAIAEVGG